MNGEEPSVVEVGAALTAAGEIRFAWRCGEERFEQRGSAERAAQLADERRALFRRLGDGFTVDEDLAVLGRELGRLAAGEDNAETLLTWLGAADFALCRIDAAAPLLAALPWETLWLPRTDEPLLFSAAVKNGVEIVREHPEGAAAGRRVDNKCLAAFCPRGELLVDKEVDELRLRLLRHPALRFRWVIDPDRDELLARLQLECTLFLFAGHGRLTGERYDVELKSASVDAAALQPALIRSRAEVLIFDSCESADGDTRCGLPALLSALPSATCLLGMAGPTDDTLSCWHMPGLVERLFLGEPVWSSVHLLRRMLYEGQSAFWATPVLHLKRSYRPFAPSPGTSSYLDALAAQVLARRKPSTG